MKKKKTICLTIAVVAVLLIAGVLLLCIVPVKTDWHKTVKFYNFRNENIYFSLPDTTKLDELTDYVEVECDFTVIHTLTYTTIKNGSVKFCDREYEVKIAPNYSSDNNTKLIALHGDNNSDISVFRETLDSMYLSGSCNYIKLEIYGTEYFSGIGGCETLGEMKTALGEFGYSFF